MEASQLARTPNTSPAHKQKQQTHQNEHPNAYLCQYAFEALPHACKPKLRTHTVTTRLSHLSHRCRQLPRPVEHPAHHLNANTSSKHTKISDRTPGADGSRVGNQMQAASCAPAAHTRRRVSAAHPQLAASCRAARHLRRTPARTQTRKCSQKSAHFRQPRGWWTIPPVVAAAAGQHGGSESRQAPRSCRT